ncbi:hypothetical protein ColLi_02477 [Colletotrichum liriopes]|uniref:Uncharacterized protein n=1 Tax=Colletotrichum liriopes TaxID=708192 RepID=A0AA37GF95_9PEZI|nr:hypothetical protein ColLi_02477 [Colletotrichum liriopes]
MAEKLFSADQYDTLAAFVKEEMGGSRSALKVDGIEELKRITECLRASAYKRLEDVLSEPAIMSLKSRGQEQYTTDVVCHAASLSIMAKVRASGSRYLPGDSSRAWEKGMPLVRLARELYTSPEASPHPGAHPIDSKLTVHYLALYHKCRVIWTDYLDQHLTIRRSGSTKVILVYQHKIWLASHANQAERCLVPQEVIREALDTLNLLFPHNDRGTESFLEKRGQKFSGLGYCGRERKLNLSSYPHWGHRIKELVDIFEGHRSGVWQFLPRKDRMNLLDSANFWIATAALLLAIVSFILSLMSIIYAKWSYDIGKESLVVSLDSFELTRLQYQLSLAQACSDAEEARLLPDFCSAEV